MKIISGKLKGRNLVGYDIQGTRPTMDRVKESVFATIQNNLDHALVLDLFAGSGNYGIEAYSNGARYVYLNDANKKCVKVINDNLVNFGVKDYFTVTCMDYMMCLNTLKSKNNKFDLVFLDPPYSMHVCEKIMMFLANNELLNSKALVICEVTDNSMNDTISNLHLLKSKKYGDKYVFIYQNNL